MTAAVLPYTPNWNDFHLKFNSVSAGSALAQSMRYAEPWLQKTTVGVLGGSLNIRPTSSRPSLILNGSRWNSESSKSSKNTCHFATVRSRGYSNKKNVKNICYVAAEKINDPYEHMRKSRMVLGGQRAKEVGCVPPRLKNASTWNAEKRRGNKFEETKRKSILECDINPYDLVEKTDESSEASLSDDCVSGAGSPATKDRAFISSNKKQKMFSLRDKIRMKSPDRKSNENAPESVKSNDKVVEGITIGGQRIRIFATPGQNVETQPQQLDSEWFQDETDAECAPEDGSHPPKRPPRKVRSRKCEEKVFREKARVEVKSILKKSTERSDRTEGDINLEDDGVTGVTIVECPLSVSKKVKKQVQFECAGQDSTSCLDDRKNVRVISSVKPVTETSRSNSSTDVPSSRSDTYSVPVASSTTREQFSENRSQNSEFSNNQPDVPGGLKETNTVICNLRRSNSDQSHFQSNGKVYPYQDRFQDTMRLRFCSTDGDDPKFLNSKSFQKNRNKCIVKPSVPPPLPPVAINNGNRVGTFENDGGPKVTFCFALFNEKPYLPPRQYFPLEGRICTEDGNSADNKIFDKNCGGIISSNQKMLVFESKERLPSLAEMFVKNKGLPSIQNGEAAPNDSDNKSIMRIKLCGKIESDNKKTVVDITPIIDSALASNNHDYEEVAPDLYNNQSTVDFVTDCYKTTYADNRVTINVYSLPNKNGTGTRTRTAGASNLANRAISLPLAPKEQSFYDDPKEEDKLFAETNKSSESIIEYCVENRQIPKCEEKYLSAPRASNYNTNKFTRNDISPDRKAIYSPNNYHSNKFIRNDISSFRKAHPFAGNYASSDVPEDFEVISNDENNYELMEPIYEEIFEDSPPRSPDFLVNSAAEEDSLQSIFAGATKYDIINYLVGAKERCAFSIEEEDFPEISNIEGAKDNSFDLSSRISQISNISDSSQELTNQSVKCPDISCKSSYKSSVDVERNDSGVGSETSKCSRSKWQKIPQKSSSYDHQYMCEDCEQSVESISRRNASTYDAMLCRKCLKRRIERREIIAEIVETEEKYGRDLRITLEHFYKPMLVAGLLTSEQLSSIFLNIEELIENNEVLAEKLRDAYEIAIEQGDEDLLTANIGQIFVDCASMLHAFESYCTRQSGAALLLSNLEKEKELLSIFLRVSQMDNTVLRKMNLNSFLMVPVQRVTKYPLLLSRLYKVTPEHQIVQRKLLKEAQHNIELHLEHINSMARDIGLGSTKLWRRFSMINVRRSANEADEMLNIKLQKAAVELLEWCYEEVRFAMEGRLFCMQSNEWRKNGRQIKMSPVNALLVTLGKPADNYNPHSDETLIFPTQLGIREASLVLMKEKSGRYSLLREPMQLDRCIVCNSESECEKLFEIQEIPSKETFIFKGEDDERTKKWCRVLQYHCQGLGCWRKRRNALANIMINGMQIRT